VENFKNEIKEITEENKEDINNITRKIKESLKAEEKCSFIKPRDSRNYRNTDSKNGYSKNRKIEEYQMAGVNKCNCAFESCKGISGKWKHQCISCFHYIF